MSTGGFVVVISGHVQIDEQLSIHYQQAGQGDRVVLLLPGWTMSTAVFERQFEFFEQSEEFRFISFDPRAHGLSSKTVEGHNYAQHGRDLHEFISALQLDRFILGGWSFGTLATLAYVSLFGADRLSGLIMLDGPPRATAEDNQTDWATYRYDDADGGQRLYSERRLSEPERANREFAAWMLEDKSEQNIRWVLDITEQTPNETATSLNQASIMLDYRDVLRALDGRIPLWYLVRAEQLQLATDWARINTPSARVTGFGEHLMFWERAEEFNRQLTEFARQCG